MRQKQRLPKKKKYKSQTVDHKNSTATTTGALFEAWWPLMASCLGFWFWS